MFLSLLGLYHALLLDDMFPSSSIDRGPSVYTEVLCQIIFASCIGQSVGLWHFALGVINIWK